MVRKTNADRSNEFAASRVTRQILRELSSLASMHRALTSQRLAALPSEKRRARVQAWRESLALARDLGLILLVVVALGAAGVFVGVLCYQAWNSDKVIVDEFQVPSEFASHGMNGAVVATALLDQLIGIQDRTRVSGFANVALGHPTPENAWIKEIHFEIALARVSLSDPVQLLYDWLGHETHVGGYIVQKGDLIELTIRGSGIVAKPFAGRPEQLSGLLLQGAEYILGRIKPSYLEYYLAINGRDLEAAAVLRELLDRIPSTSAKRPELLGDLADKYYRLNKYGEAAKQLREVMRLRPSDRDAYAELTYVQAALGEEEAALTTGENLVAHHAPHGILYGAVDALKMDLPQLKEDIEDTLAPLTSSQSRAQWVLMLADTLARMHDPMAALAQLELETDGPIIRAGRHLVSGRRLFEIGKYPEALDEFSHFAVIYRENGLIRAWMPAALCTLGLAEEMVGHRSEADEAIAETDTLARKSQAKEPQFVDCQRFRGDIEDHRQQIDQRSDGRTVEAYYLLAVERAPHLPATYESWGEALMRHGKLDAAVEKFDMANHLAPHWADPLERWGEALVMQGKEPEAIKKFAAAVPYAPNWGALQVHWGEALDRLADHGEARKKYMAACDMELSEAHRFEIASYCPRARARDRDPDYTSTMQ